MTKRNKVIISFFGLTGIFLLWFGPCVCADTIYMKSGEVIEGEIVSNIEGVIIVRENFEGFGFGESNYLMKNVIRVVKPEEVLTVKGSGAKPPSLEELTVAIGNALGEENLLTQFYLKGGIYRIRYYYPISISLNKDRRGVEAVFFKILAVFLNYNIDDFRLIQIEASTVGDKDKGILADAEITLRQFIKYKSNPKKFSIKDIEKFNFFDRFYK